MCLSIPAKVEKILGESAVCTVGGIKYEASLQMLEAGEVQPGDYVLLHAGFAIQKISTQEAISTLEIFDEFRDMNEQLDQEESITGKRIV